MAVRYAALSLRAAYRTAISAAASAESARAEKYMCVIVIR